MRRCTGCGQAAPKTKLFRLALTAEKPGTFERLVVLDRDGIMPGRGAYLCRAADGRHIAAACLAKAQAKKSITRTLRSQAKIDSELVQSVGQ